jgi:hypothetical protein
MNIYIVVEGRITEKLVYKSWIPFVNPLLTQIENPSLFTDNNFLIISGGGYPCYFEVIENAINDINSYKNIDRLVIAIDSEEQSYQEKYDEINNFIVPFHCEFDTQIIIQHFCIEAWALGNRKINTRNVQNEKLRDFKTLYDVYNNDPENLPANGKLNLNRAHFACRYLSLLLQEKNPRLSYSKSNPKALMNELYIKRLKERYIDTNHLKSIDNFFKAFV